MQEQVIKTYVHMWPNAVQQVLKRYDPESDALPGSITAAEAALAELLLEVVNRLEALELDRLGLLCRRCNMLENIRGEIAETEEEVAARKKNGIHDNLALEATLRELEYEQDRWYVKPCACFDPARPDREHAAPEGSTS